MKKQRSQKRYIKKGGHGLPALNPSNYSDSVGTFGAVNAEANYGKMPNVFPSKQVGGMGYGFSTGSASLVPSVAGSYFPISPTCSSHVDLARGGNNFVGGSNFVGGGKKQKQKGGIVLIGGRRRRGTSKRSSTKRSSSNKRSRSKRSSTKRSSTGTLKKWWQEGCNKMKGGLFIV